MQRLMLLSFFCASVCRDVQPQKENYLPDYNVYHNSTSINTLIEELTDKHTDLIKYHLLLNSHDNAPIHVLRVTNFSHPHKAGDRIKVLIVAGEHARELTPVEVVLQLLQRVARAHGEAASTTNHKLVSWMLESYDLYFFPLANPDGRRRLEEEHNYCWRGNTRGVDLNRNFGWDWGGQGASRDPKDEEYAGIEAFSELESKGLLKIMMEGDFDVFMSLHSGIRQVYTPFGDATSWSTGRQPRFHNIMQQVLETALEVYDRQRHKWPFQAGPAHEVNDYAVSGTSFDYACGVLYVPLCFALELYGEGDGEDNQCFDLFNPPSEKLEETVQIAETMLVSMLKAVQLHWTKDLTTWRRERHTLMPQLFEEMPNESDTGSDYVWVVVFSIGAIVLVVGLLRIHVFSGWQRLIGSSAD
eukprot:m.28919 g.28919  ORF g.28919 m.28919 type:complete len:414 (-) comp11897_c0_seq1:51-1292(-)